MKNSTMWARQYSKRLITFLLVVWVAGGVIGVGYEFIRLIASPETASMEALYVYLAVPFTCGIPSYLISAAILNKEKVRQNYIPDYDNTVLCGEYANEEGIGAQNITEELNGTGFYAHSETLPGETGSDHLSDS